MAYGVAGVVGFGLVLGILCSLWNRIGTISGHRTLLLLSVAGFFWVTVAIRSYS